MASPDTIILLIVDYWEGGGVEAVSGWMSANRLKLNVDKAECI